MKCAVIRVYIPDVNDTIDILEEKKIDLSNVSERRAQDVMFQLMLEYAQKLDVPRHAVVSDETDGLHMRINYRDNSHLFADFIIKDLPDGSITDNDILNRCREYKIEYGYWLEMIGLFTDYTLDNFYEILEKWLLGEYVTT